jgi:hypothetical protein
MNCIHPSAPAELGPMFRPKSDSILLIAARTSHGTPYAAPASRHRARSCWYERCSRTAGGVDIANGVTSASGRFGVSWLGRLAAGAA